MKRQDMKRYSLALVLLAAGCTPMQWVRPDSPPPQQIDADIQHCQAEAWSEAAWRYPPSSRGYGAWPYRDPLGRRFIGYPYGAFGDPFGDRDMEEQRLLNFCMRAKGYELVPAPKS